MRFPVRRRRRPATRTPLGETIERGWNDVPWGCALQEFRRRFPGATRTESGWWLTGQGPEPFCGVAMAYTQYGFNDGDQLSMVALIPATPQREQLSVSAINALGAPDGLDLSWTLGDVVVDVKAAGMAATMTHRHYVK